MVVVWCCVLVCFVWLGFYEFFTFVVCLVRLFVDSFTSDTALYDFV